MMQATRCLGRTSLLLNLRHQNVVVKSLRTPHLSKPFRQSTTAVSSQAIRRSYASASSNTTTGQEQKSHEQKEEDRRRTRLVAVMIGSAVGFLGSSYILYRKLTASSAKAEAATVQNASEAKDEVAGLEGNKEEEDGEKEGKKKRRKGFRDRRIVEYENRIRQYSTPDKVFRYFATLKIVHPGAENEVFMTPEDFVRSLTPGKKQPDGLGLDEHEKFHPEKHKYKGYDSEEMRDSSIFMKMGEHGLISFSDYIFLLTVLSLPPRMFEIAFQMFDLNGDGEVSPEEFEKVQNILFSLTATGSRHRDHSTTGSVLSAHVNTGLRIYFFGQDEKSKLTIQNFVDFQKKLQKEVMYLEFMSYEPQDDKITEVEFADMLLTYSSFQEKKKQQILKRVKKAFKENKKGITFKDYLNFFCFLRNINEAEVALSFHIAANKAIDPETFKQVGSTITGVTLNDHVVDVVYKMFDENDDGELSHKEFISVMKNQAVRGLENPKDTGFTKLMSALIHCAKHQVYDTLHPRRKEQQM